VLDLKLKKTKSVVPSPIFRLDEAAGGFPRLRSGLDPSKTDLASLCPRTTFCVRFKIQEDKNNKIDAFR